MIVTDSKDSKPVIFVVLVQRDEGEFNYWADDDVEREVKVRLEDSALMKDFEVCHVKYVPGDVTAAASQPMRAARGAARSILAGNEGWR